MENAKILSFSVNNKDLTPLFPIAASIKWKHSGPDYKKESTPKERGFDGPQRGLKVPLQESTVLWPALARLAWES